MAKSQVAIVKTPKDPDYDQIRAAVEKSVNLLGGMKDIVKRGAKVLVNPSWVTAVTKREEAAITLPEVDSGSGGFSKRRGGKADHS